MLKQTLRGARLELAVAGNQAVAIRPGLDVVRDQTYPIEDLARSDAQSLESLLHAMCVPPNSDASLTIRDGQLRLHGDTATHYAVRIFCERLRKARGLAVASKYPQELLHVTPALTWLRPTLDRKTTFSFVSWTPVAEIVNYWRQTSKLTILVDWQELDSVEITPQTPLACGVIDRRWEASLDAVLGPLGLAWRPIDGETIEITTRDAADHAALVEFYPLRADQRASAEDLARSIGSPDDGVVAMYDEPSGTLLVRAPATAQRRADALLNAP